MPTTVRSFGKINIGLCIGPRRDDGFHSLRTVYQTIALHDVIKVAAFRGVGIEVRCKDPNVPTDESNTCWRIAERVLKAKRKRARITISIKKNLPVQGGLGAASSNAIAVLHALELELRQRLEPEQRLQIAAEIGSDLPLFLVGGTVLGLGRGEEVYPLADLPTMHCVTVMPKVAISTPKAFADWDHFRGHQEAKLTPAASFDKINSFSRSVFSWLAGCPTGVPAAPGAKCTGRKSGDRAETLLLALVRAGIENDFERVVFPQYPEVREVKRVLEREGARYSSLSGSGSALYGLFDCAGTAAKAAERLQQKGIAAVASRTLTRSEYWRKLFT